MLYPEGLMHRKINIGLALLVIFAVAGIFAWIISARAIVQPGIALRILSPPIPCTPDPPPNSATCLLSCGTCGSLVGCAGMFEVKATYLQGLPLLMQGAGGPALCLSALSGGVPTPPKAVPNPAFTPGAICIGNIKLTPLGHDLGPPKIGNFGCSF